MATLGFESLFTIVVPGSIAVVSFLLILWHFQNTSPLFYLATHYQDNEWVMGAAILVGSIAFGGMLATIMGSVVEEKLFDRWSAASVIEGNFTAKEKRDVFDCEWQKYIDSLTTDNNNPYVSRLAMFFFFESRLALSLLALCVATALWHAWVTAGVAFVVAVLFAHSSFAAHRELALYRHRTFPCLPSGKSSTPG